MYVHKGIDYCIKPPVRGKLDKRILELATIGIYGHGEWLNCLATKVYKHGPYETR